MPITKSHARSRTGAYIMSFARLGNQIIVFQRIQKHIGGRGKVERVKLFTEKEPIACIPPSTFQDMVQDGAIERLDLPRALTTWAEWLSGMIGQEFTPQEALALMQQKLQDHATTLNARSATAGEVVK